MLNDIQLFVFSWILFIVIIIIFVIQFYFTSQTIAIQTRKKKQDEGNRISLDVMKKIPYVTFPLFFILSIIGIVVDLVNWIPIHEMNEATTIFRNLRISTAIFGSYLIFGICYLPCYRFVSKSDLEIVDCEKEEDEPDSEHRFEEN